MRMLSSFLTIIARQFFLLAIFENELGIMRVCVGLAVIPAKEIEPVLLMSPVEVGAPSPHLPNAAVA